MTNDGAGQPNFISLIQKYLCTDCNIVKWIEVDGGGDDDGPRKQLHAPYQPYAGQSQHGQSNLRKTSEGKNKEM